MSTLTQRRTRTRVNRDRIEQTVAAWSTRLVDTHRPTRTGVSDTSMFAPLVWRGKSGHEIWRMNARPELYPEWYIDALSDAFDVYLTRVDKVSFDCDRCQIAVVVDTIADPCPHCGER